MIERVESLETAIDVHVCTEHLSALVVFLMSDGVGDVNRRKILKKIRKATFIPDDIHSAEQLRKHLLTACVTCAEILDPNLVVIR